MRKYIVYGLLFGSICLFCVSCGISKEIRTASISLVAKQKVSLEAHIAFHTATLKTLFMILDAEQVKSDRDYKDVIAKYHNAMLDELKTIYENKVLSEADKKVKEEEARYEIMGFIQEAEDNKDKRDKYINGAKDNLLNASNSLIEGEKAKSLAIEKLDKYLQAKRPSEKLLEMIDLDLEKYTEYIGEANKAMKLAEPFIDKL